MPSRRANATRSGRDAAGTRLVFVDAAGSAWSVQGVDVPAPRGRARCLRHRSTSSRSAIGGARSRRRAVDVVLDVAAGRDRRFGYVKAVGDHAARRLSPSSTRSPPTSTAAVAAAERYWNAQLEAIFTPGNSEYSGHLPAARDVVGDAPPPLLVGRRSASSGSAATSRATCSGAATTRSCRTTGARRPSSGTTA